ncbi:hypothetical protein [Desulfonatronum thiodismutans]|uniref:hypothetical protein n=1 Tax=Desulfonatronum thiodismutans TaxID=159290 RepID=UPI0004ABD2FA|nr:hypothetical protein [Desulfonatronum thiodismutans]
MDIKQVNKWDIFAITLSFLAFSFAYCIATFVFQHATLNADENSYLFQAQNFLEGIVARPSPPFPASFHHEMIIIAPDVGWLSRYAPGHSLFLAPGVLVGNPYMWVALAAGLSLFLVYLSGKLLGGHVAGVSAAILLLFSPYFLLYYGTLVSHTSGLLAAAAMLASYIYWRQTGDARFAIIAGLAWAFLFNNRTYTALLIAIPFSIDSMWRLYRERTLRMLKSTCYFALASASGVLAILIYNTLSTGDPLMMTYLKYTETQKLGFGSRHFGRIDHSLSRGLGILVSNVSLLNTWLWGFFGSLILCLALAFIGWKKHWTKLLIGAILSVWIGYVYFWYQGSRDFGPLYYYETLPFIIIVASLGISRILNYVKLRYLLIFMAIWLGINIPFIVSASLDMRERNLPRRLVLDALDGAPRGSLVFINPREHRDAFKDGNDMIFNPRGLNGDIIVVRWLESSNNAVMRYFNEYEPLWLTKENGANVFVPMPVDRMHIEIPVQIMHRLTGENSEDENRPGNVIRLAHENKHPSGLIAFGRYYELYQGRFAVEFDVRATPGQDGTPSMQIEVAYDLGQKIIDSRTVGLRETWETERIEFLLDDFISAEPRVFFLGAGKAEIAAIRVMEME